MREAWYFVIIGVLLFILTDNAQEINQLKTDLKQCKLVSADLTIIQDEIVGALRFDKGKIRDRFYGSSKKSEQNRIKKGDFLGRIEN